MVKYDKVKSTGRGMRKFKSGAVRDVVKGKGRYDLISPLVMERYAKHYENGAEKYDPRNWEEGIELSVYIDSMIRHAFKFLGGSRDEDHMAAVMWNAGGVIHTMEQIERGNLPKELNDLPDYTRKKRRK